jgi:hypothetical protein
MRVCSSVPSFRPSFSPRFTEGVDGVTRAISGFSDGPVGRTLSECGDLSPLFKSADKSAHSIGLSLGLAALQLTTDH